MAKPILIDLDFNSAAKIVNLPQGVNPNDPVVMSQLTAAIENLGWKDDVKVATQSNINLASPGATIDSITMVSGDRVLVKAQTAATDNGIYIWTGASTPMTRAYDLSASTDFNAAITSVDQGTSGGTSYRQTAVNPTVGTTSIVWTNFGTVAAPASNTSAGIIRIATQTEVNTGTDLTIAITPGTLAASQFAKLKYSTTIGDGSSNTYVVTHNLNTQDVAIEVYETTGTFRKVELDTAHSTSNSVTVNSKAALTSNGYKVVVIG